MTRGQKYFNTPIQLYSTFLDNHLDVLQNVAAYACYDYCKTQQTTFENAASYYDLAFVDLEKLKKIGQAQFEKYPTNSPKVGIGLDTWRRFMNESKEEFEKVCLLAFLAMKSALGQKLFVQMDNQRLLSRMAGFVTKKEFINLPPNLLRYNNRYQLDKIKGELADSWGLKYYARRMHGFCVSFTMTKENLIRAVEMRRKKTVQKKTKEEEKELVKKVLKELE